MKAKYFNHIGINIKDVEKSKKFYGEILGLKHQSTFEKDDFQLIYYLMENGERIELFNYFGKNDDVSDDETKVGYRHIAIEVDSVDEWENHLKENCVKIVMSCTDLNDIGVRVLLFEDPSGVVLEFCETI